MVAYRNACIPLKFFAWFRSRLTSACIAFCLPDPVKEISLRFHSEGTRNFVAFASDYSLLLARLGEKFLFSSRYIDFFFTVRNFILLQIFVENSDYSKPQIFTRRDSIMISLVSVISIALAISVRDAAAAKTPEKPSSQVSLLHVYMCIYGCKGMICYGVYFPREVSGYLVKNV